MPFYKTSSIDGYKKKVKYNENLLLNWYLGSSLEKNPGKIINELDKKDEKN